MPDTERGVGHFSVEDLENLRERLRRRTVVTDGCWLWVGAVSSPDGYGRISVTVDGVETTLSAHRAAVLSSGVRLQTGAVIEHHCNEPLCVRVDPEHVHVSTQSANMRHAVATGRAAGPRVVVDSSKRVERSRAVRALALRGFDESAYVDLVQRFTVVVDPGDDQLTLW